MLLSLFTNLHVKFISALYLKWFDEFYLKYAYFSLALLFLIHLILRLTCVFLEHNYYFSNYSPFIAIEYNCFTH